MIKISLCVSCQALFNRLLLPEPGNHLIYMTSCNAVNMSADRDAGEKSAIPYLFACYQRAKEEVNAPLTSHRVVYIVVDLTMNDLQSLSVDDNIAH